jgi:putative sigma-54 modulation protein
VVSILKVSIVVHQTYANDKTKELILSRMNRFDKFFSREAQATATLSEKRDLKILEITISCDGVLFRAEVAGNSFQSDLDEAIDIIERQIRKHKTRLLKKVKSGALSDLVAFPEDIDDEDEEAEGEFQIRVKSFSVKPMSVEEAIMQMELLGHSFFVFRDFENDQIEVVYAKKDGTYGLIVPQD